ncbi:MAG: hypothetical protein OXE94_02460 [Aestuariivita sp.]|nr:hypothetical protein [Aestuariivita sp.]MCY4203722.1 hypothetical protein [Aestuariivita sp.]
MVDALVLVSVFLNLLVGSGRVRVNRRAFPYVALDETVQALTGCVQYDLRRYGSGLPVFGADNGRLAYQSAAQPLPLAEM